MLACITASKFGFYTPPPHHHSLIGLDYQVIDHQLFTVDIEAFSLQLLHRFIEQLLDVPDTLCL